MVAKGRQIALSLADGLPRDPDAIVTGPANAAVVEALSNPHRWPYRTAILTGPKRSGKTLLGRWFGESGRGTVIDGADGWDETRLFHRWNAAQGAGQALLLIADRTPWVPALPDLASRLGAGLQLAIDTPDDAMLADLIMSHGGRRGLALGPEAITYLVPRIDRSFAVVEEVVARIDRLSLERKTAPGPSIWRAALAMDADGGT